MEFSKITILRTSENWWTAYAANIEMFSCRGEGTTPQGALDHFLSEYKDFENTLSKENLK